jgi:hypothetical protein
MNRSLKASIAARISSLGPEGSIALARERLEAFPFAKTVVPEVVGVLPSGKKVAGRR